MSIAPLYTTASGRLFHAGLVLIVVVGLPARGKTHISRSVDRYMRWLGVKSQVFSLGDHRRKVMGDPHELPNDYFATDGSQSESTRNLRENVKKSLLRLVGDFFQHGGQVAIYDANNGTRAARQQLRQEFEPRGVHLMFIENVCDRKDVIEQNIKAVKISSPDYEGWDPEAALADYWGRIRDHEKTYEPIEQPSFPFVKVINLGEKIIVNNISGYLQSRIVFYLMQIHNSYRTIWFARSGPSRIEHLYKADSELSPLGQEYAERLCKFLRQKRREVRNSGEKENRLSVWTSTRRRCVQTSAPMARAGYKVVMRSQMNEINPGVIDGMSAAEIKERYPEEYEKSLNEPYAHRYPRAESYHDLSVRLEPVIFEVERDRSDLFIIGHASVIKCLFAYLKGLPPQDIPLVGIRRGQLIEVTPTSYGVKARTHTFWTPSDNPILYKFVSDEDAFHHVPESEQKAEELNRSIAPLAI
ncbi:cytoplasm protein [Phakopsora pachyrhizi]|uniref:Cytoplasm protein n=1 Tax=Phakopsora pachyrhizi TaxID=170000 RepID=A0AAV0AGH9_PHAPC|nr:cytoplasm protein [Phakopsora pachyrhizi]KAI8448130.1 cytoplasm protein [Phakopsora pachyrhizi]CAH7665754.1 cytoplasm protein [Phakopsora pachyrhizi]CAH7667516.1 cytoplasm protein [Phakopsora pachyrhizi]